MSNIRTIEGDFSAANATFALVVARFNNFIVDSLQAGAIDALVPDDRAHFRDHNCDQDPDNDHYHQHLEHGEA